MGKGNRSRDGRDDSILTKTQKPKKQKRGHRPLPKWLVPTLVSIVAVVVVFAIVFAALVNNGVFKRNNVLVKSQQQSKFTVNQMAAQIMLWYSGWVQGQNAYYSTISTSTEYNQNTEFSWCWAYASTSQTNLKETIADSADWLEEMVALCDWGLKNNVPFTAEDEETAYETFVSAFRSQAKSYYKYANEVGFPNDAGETEKFPYDYSSYVDYPSYPYFSGFLRNIFGKGISGADFHRAANILTYASRVKTLKEAEYWNADETTVDEELKENPGNYYSADYLKYTADEFALTLELIKAAGGEDGVNAYKKLIVQHYIEENYFGEYNKLFANKLLDALKDKTGDDLAAALEANGLAAIDLEKPAVEPAAEGGEEGEGEGDAEPAEGGEEGDGEGDAEPAEGGEEEGGLTKKQSDWLFNKDRAANNMGVITEEDGSSTLLVITDVTKDDDGNVTAVKAVVKNFSETLSEDELNVLFNEVCHHLDLPHDDAHADEEAPEGDAEPAEGEGEGDAEPAEGGEEGDGEPAEGEEEPAEEDTVWDDLVEAMEAGAKNELPKEATIAYTKAADLDKKVEDTKTALEAKETVDDKVSYLKDEGASENLGTTADNQNIAAEIKAVIFPEEGTVEAGLVQIVEVEGVKHLIYVSEVKTDGEGEAAKTLVTFYDYTPSEYSTEFQKWLFAEVDTDSMISSRAVGKTFYDEETGAVYIITRALGLGVDAVRGAYASFTSLDAAQAAKEQLKGLTGIELVNKLAEIKSDATASSKITEASISSETLKAWLFSDERAENDYDVIYEEDEKGNVLNGIYVAVYLAKTSEGESDARSTIADEKADDFAHELAESGNYKLNEKALAKVGTWLYK